MKVYSGWLAPVLLIWHLQRALSLALFLALDFSVLHILLSSDLAGHFTHTSLDFPIKQGHFLLSFLVRFALDLIGIIPDISL